MCVFQSYELTNSEIVCPVLIRSFPGSFVSGSPLEGILSIIPKKIKKWKSEKVKKSDHFLQIWIISYLSGVRSDQKHFSESPYHEKYCLGTFQN